MQFKVLGHCIVPAQMLHTLELLSREGGFTYNSVYRGEDARVLLHSVGQFTQSEMYHMSAAERAKHGIGGVNPPGTSAHELRSDGVAYHNVPRGNALSYWQIGLDVSNSTSAVQTAKKHGWELYRPYPTEGWHLQFRNDPTLVTTKICDHSTGGAIIGGTLKANGFHGVIRYASAGRNDVNITPREIADLKANGIAIGIVNEHAADYLLGGHNVGKQRAGEAQQIAHACGLPDGVVYMAGDFDATLGGPTHPGSPGDRNMNQIHAALQGAADGIGQNNVGFYGSYFAIDWLVHHAPWIKYYWQTPGWSSRLLHPTADVYQGNPTTRDVTSFHVAGVEVDGDVAISGDWGQRTEKPGPGVHHQPTGHFNADLSLIANTGSWSLKGKPSSDVHFGTDDRLDTLAIGVYVGGPNKGKWVKKSMPKNWKPPGGW